MQQSLETVGLTKTYGSFAALSDLNLKIEGAKIVGFLGPNGAGKTTTLKLLTDLIRPSSGKALINGHNVHTHKKAALASVGTVVETPEIYLSLTPREALSMVADIRGVPHSERAKRIEESLAEVRMTEWTDKRVGKFSKGMKQRVVIASSLLSDPDILLLDEPTNGLDPRGMNEVREIVKSLKSKDRLIFMSSHLLSEVSELCDDIAIIDHGKLLAYDTLQNVTAKFSGGGNVIEVGLIRPIDERTLTKSLLKVPGVISAERADSKGLRLKFTGGPESQERILGELVRLGIGVVSFRPASSQLEDVYLNLIKETL